MSFLAWNCRGLGNPCTIRELGDLIRAKDPSVVFLVETWADEARLKEIKRNLNFDNLHFVERINRDGGLALLWKDSVDLHVETSSKNHIDAIVNKGDDGAWRITGFYGEPVTHRRMESWNLLRELYSRMQLPWLCFGDFNELTRQSEKLGSSVRSQAQMQMFRDAIDECGFMDLGFTRSQFTWKKHFSDGHSVWERLDRGMANSEWMLRFAGTVVHHLSSFSSDHCPIWIVPRTLIYPSASKPFRFEEMWLTEKGCTDTIQAVWAVSDSTDPGTKVIKKIEKCGVELKKWSLKSFGSVRKELERKKKEIVQAEQEAMRTGQNFRVRELMRELNILMDKEARMWLQRSKVQWAKYGDRNSRYFHARATQRLRKNSISTLRRADGTWCSNLDEVADTIVDYYQNLFTSASPTNLENTI